MRLTHVGHSCLLVEVGDSRLLLDPGAFSAGFEDLTGLDAVVITHQHVDHVDTDRLPGVLAANPGTVLLAEPQTVAALAEKGIEAEALGAGDERTVGRARLRAVGGEHALIHRDVARVGNVGVLVDAGEGPVLFHPGDAIDVVPDGVDVLAVPLNAPWCALKETIDFVRAVAPGMAFPIHDALVQPGGRSLYLGHVERLSPDDTTVRDLAGAGAVDLDGPEL